MRKVRFRDWEFEVDSELTRETYAKVIGGFSEGCDCQYCLNYHPQKDEIFPKEIRTLFENLGIDYHKESECLSSFDISEFSNTDEYLSKLHGYSGWFHFYQNILSGKECFDRNSNTYDSTQITENFSIGFRKSKDLNFFEFGIPLVQVEFGAKIPWIIGDMVED
ncbi:MAG: hypothetical protein LH614_19340 [Pyrinomonadaceae bacterium]|nr:hypothetical protein [Pyrinomonadaceae bacterium]